MADLHKCKVRPLSVVIPTLGGSSLRNTIDQLNAGSVVPSEILICIPSEDSYKVATLSYPNVKVVPTERRGQVAQRAIGFQRASCDVVMQLDDDVVIDEGCVEHLLDTLMAQGPKTAVAPSLINLATGVSFYRKKNRKRILDKIYYWVMNGSGGYQPGKINKAGVNVGVDPEGAGSEVCDVEWVAGGCVMHHRKNLVLEAFYPFEGKAFCEDLIHTHILKSRGIRLVIDLRASCRSKVIPETSQTWREIVRSMRADYRARRYFLRISSRQSFRIYFFYLTSLLSCVYKKTFKAQGTSLSGKS